MFILSSSFVLRKPVICTCDTQECSKTPSSSSLELSYTSFSISQIKYDGGTNGCMWEWVRVEVC